MFQERTDAGKSVDFDRILSSRLTRTTGSTGTVKLVNTIEYQAGDYQGVRRLVISQTEDYICVVNVQAAPLQI